MGAQREQEPGWTGDHHLLLLVLVLPQRLLGGGMQGLGLQGLHRGLPAVEGIGLLLQLPALLLHLALLLLVDPLEVLKLLVELGAEMGELGLCGDPARPLPPWPGLTTNPSAHTPPSPSPSAPALSPSLC